MKSDTVIFTLTLVACVGFVMPHMHMNHETGDKVHNKPQKSQYRSGTVFLDSSGKFSFKADVIDKDHGVAYGYFNSTLNQTGWGVLEITAECAKRKSLDESTSCTDNDAMYAAGLLEGILTSEQIWQNYLNIRPFYLDPNNNTMEMLYRWFFRKQDEWTRQNIKSNRDEVWTVISFIVSQFDGLAEGYRQAASSAWESDVLVPQFLNAVGDMIDLRYFLKPSMRPDFRKMTKSQLRSYVSANGHCSALIKVTGGFENIFMSHSSWFVYAATMRIYKHYHFNLNSPLAAMKSMSFSSYPGFLESLDDFYLLDTGLVVLQTTNQVFNTSLYDQITPSSLLAWQRVRAANIMSHHGHEWSKYFSSYNSGTYNNQYMIIDLNKINLNKNIEDGALHIVEQIPLHVAVVDATEILDRGYFASYNVPFIDEIYQESGYPDIVALHGTDFSYQLAPRAKIFRRDAGNVQTLEDMMDIMRYNNYKNDTYSKGNACNTICCRGDLVTDMDALKQEHVSGCYDTKVADYFMAMKLRSVAINGPTTSHQLPPFSWTGKYASESHIGLPTEYKFSWQVMEPQL